MSIFHKINVVRFLFWLTIIFSCYEFSFATYGSKCDIQRLFDQCGPNETCKENGSLPGFGVCECSIQFIEKGGNCIPKQPLTPSKPVSPTVEPKDDEQTSSRGGFPVLIWLIVPCLIVAIVSGLIFIGRRYMWMERLYQLRVRHYDTVLINNQGDDDDDDDDPPIA